MNGVGLIKKIFLILWGFLMYMSPLILWDFLMYYLLWGFLMYRGSLILWGFLMYRVPFSIMGLSYVQLVCKIIGFSPNPSQCT